MAYMSAIHSVTIGIWQKVGGVWSKVTTKTVYTSTPATSGNHTMPWIINEPFQLSSGATEFGVTLDSDSINATGSALTDFNSVSWQSTASSGTRTATPNNQLTSITVRPQ